MKKEARYTMEKRQFSVSGAGKTGHVLAKQRLELSLTPYTKINSKCFKDPRLRPQTTKLLEENISRTLVDKNSSIFFDESSKAKEIKAKIVKRDVIKLKEFLHRKENHKK